MDSLMPRYPSLFLASLLWLPLVTSAAPAEFKWVAPIKASEISSVLKWNDHQLEVDQAFEQTMNISQKSDILQQLRSIASKATRTDGATLEKMLMYPSANAPQYEPNEHPIAYAMREVLGLGWSKASPAELRNVILERVPESSMMAVGMSWGVALSQLLTKKQAIEEVAVDRNARPPSLEESRNREANILKGFLPSIAKPERMVTNCLPGDLETMNEMLGCVVGYQIAKYMWKASLQPLLPNEMNYVWRDLAYVTALAFIQTTHGLLDPMFGEVPLLSKLEDVIEQADRTAVKMEDKQVETVEWLQKIGSATAEDIGMQLGIKIVENAEKNDLRFKPNKRFTEIAIPMERFKELGSQTARYLSLTIFLPFLSETTAGRIALLRIYEDGLKGAENKQVLRTAVTADGKIVHQPSGQAWGAKRASMKPDGRLRLEH